MVARADLDVRFASANRISDRVLEAVRTELDAGAGPVQCLAGLCLGLVGYIRTAPPQARPLSLAVLEVAADGVLREVLALDGAL